MSITWFQLAKAEVEQKGLDPAISDVLCAFGGPDHAPGPASLSLDLADTVLLVQEIPAALSAEIDTDQANMFARRFLSVAALLDEQEEQENAKSNKNNHKNDTNQPHLTLPRILRIGLYRRAHQILHIDPPPRALRLRALVDFYWSQAVVLWGQAHQQWNEVNIPPSLTAWVRDTTIHYESIAPGCRHATLQGATRDGGPVHINILRLRNVKLRTVDARASQLHDNQAWTTLGGPQAVAAISGGFFLYSEPDICEPSKRTDPVGLLVTDGVVVGPPVFARSALVQDATTGRLSIERIGMEGVRVQFDGLPGGPYVVTAGKDRVSIHHRGHGKTVTLFREQIGISIVKNQVCQVARPDGQKGEVDSILEVPLAGFVLTFPKSKLPENVLSQLQCGGKVSYTLPRLGIQAAMAGGPLLYSANPDDRALNLPAEDFCGSAPPVTFSQDETFDRNLLPRMAAGLTADGELVLVAVDGRNLEHALGLTLQGTANLLRELGCVKAMNLDGGSSKRMFVRGKGVVCLSTTEIKAATNDPSEAEKLRPVHSAIFIYPCDEE